MAYGNSLRRWSAPPVRLIYLLMMLSSLASAGESGYLGREVCAGCHRNMVTCSSAQTYVCLQGAATPQLPASYSETHAEGPAPVIEYVVSRTGRNLQYRQ